MIIKKHETVVQGKIVPKKIKLLNVMYEDGSYELITGNDVAAKFVARFVAPASKRVKRAIVEEDVTDVPVEKPKAPLWKKPAVQPNAPNAKQIIDKDGNLVTVFNRVHLNFLRQYIDPRNTSPNKIVLNHRLSIEKVREILRKYNVQPRLRMHESKLKLPKLNAVTQVGPGVFSTKPVTSPEKEVSYVPNEKDGIVGPKDYNPNGRYSVSRIHQKRVKARDNPVLVAKIVKDYKNRTKTTTFIRTKYNISANEIYVIMRQEGVTLRNETKKVTTRKVRKGTNE